MTSGTKGRSVYENTSPETKNQLLQSITEVEPIELNENFLILW
jgi:hypothetical protein